jgi:hypothetical protein
MKSQLFILSGFAFLTGCATIQGIWALEIPITDEEDECTTDVSHNFKNASLSEDPGDSGGGGLEIVEDGSGSPLLTTIAIEQTSGSTANLIVGSSLYPGTKEQDGWHFSWERSSKYNSTSTFESAYALTEDSDSSSSVTYILTVKGDTLTGTAKTDAKETVNWSETDEWGGDAVDVIGNRGVIPAGAYLVDADGAPISNRANEAECDAVDCKLTVSSSCNGSGSFTGFRTGFEVDDVGEDALNAGQLPGGF